MKLAYFDYIFTSIHTYTLFNTHNLHANINNNNNNLRKLKMKVFILKVQLRSLAIRIYFMCS